MSHFATPFIVINLGCEMIYVIDQRLKSQNIPKDKANRVLTDIATVLLHPKLLDELFLPQPIGSHAVIKQLLLDISATTIMKLDDYSMSKLWDLMTMIFKWQISIKTNQNVFEISRRHLRCIATLMPDFFSKSVLDNALRKFEALSHKFTDNDFKCLNNILILWFSEYHTKISILIRLGLQNKDGTFSLPSTIDFNIISNLGENIYKYDNKRYGIDGHEDNIETIEINCLLARIEQDQVGKNVIKLELPIDLGNKTNKILELNRNTNFTNINTCVKIKNSDLTFTPRIPKTPQEDLIEMMDQSP